MKRIVITILAMVMIALLAGCSPSITESEVYKKEFREEYITTAFFPVIVSNGKSSTTTMVPYTIYHPDQWVIFIKAFQDDTWVTEDFYVSEAVYNAVNIGDMFKYDESRGDLQDEPYTREEKENGKSK